MSIWNSKEIFNALGNSAYYLTLDEGNTSEITLNNLETKLILKREDQNPTGSWKDRGSAYKISKLLNEGVKEAVIASSGNAAISLMTYANLSGEFLLHVVISNNTTTEKRNLINSLARDFHKIYEVDNIRIKAVELSSELKIPNLKVSVDDDILPGYWSLGLELAKHFRHQENSNSAIFIQVSSGTTLVGMIQGLHFALGSEFNMPKIFAVQTQKVHPIVDLLQEKEFETSETSLADGIIDKTALRSPQIMKIIKETQGGAISVSDDELIKARDFLKANEIDNISYTSALSIAGYLNVSKTYNFDKVICILSGR